MPALFRSLLCLSLSLMLMLGPQFALHSAWLPASLRASQTSQAQQAAAKVDLAVLDLRTHGDVSGDEARIISDRVRAELFRTGRYRIIERAEMQAILKEQAFQQSQDNCFGTDCAVELGKILAVRQMVIGSVSHLGEIYTLSLRVIDVEKGTILKEGYRDCRCLLEEVLTRLTAELAYELTGIITQAPPSQADPRMLAAMPLKERQAYYETHSKSPWLAAGLNGFLPLPFGYGYIDDWGMFWTMGLLEAGVVSSAVIYKLSAPRSILADQLLSAGMIVYIGMAVFTVVDVWLRADRGNLALRQQLRLEQASLGSLELAGTPLLPPQVSILQLSF